MKKVSSQDGCQGYIENPSEHVFFYQNNDSERNEYDDSDGGEEKEMADAASLLLNVEGAMERAVWNAR